MPPRAIPQVLNWDTRDQIIFRRASLLARVKLGETGLGSVDLPYNLFGLSLRKLFTSRELGAARHNADGITILTQDEAGRTFRVKFVYMEHSYVFRGGEDGWNGLCFMNNFSANTIVSLWVYRVPSKRGLGLTLPRVLVLNENPDPNRMPPRETLPDRRFEQLCLLCRRRCTAHHLVI